MKALILIDVDDIENTSAQVRLIKDDEVVEMFTSKLKPLPQFNKVEGTMTTPIDFNYFNLGWNSCLNTILGEEE